MTASRRFLKYWLSLMRYSTLKCSSFMFCEKFNRHFIHTSFHSYFLLGNVAQIVNSGKFSNVNAVMNLM